jgi:solute carrier family 25 (mitochondrial dicarboxylate transporter), member 10
MTGDPVKMQRYAYTDALNGFVRLITEEGIRGMTRGLGTNAVSLLLMVLSPKPESDSAR